MYGNQPLYRQDLEAIARLPLPWEKLAGARILITGAAGLIGTVLTDALRYVSREAGLGLTVCPTGRSAGRLRERFGPAAPGLEPQILDVTQPLPGGVRWDWILHAASPAHPLAFSRDPVGTLLSNVEGVRNLLEHGARTGLVRLLFVSSGEVYGQNDALTQGFGEEDYGYVDVLAPRACYPMGKRAAETLCAAYAAQYGLDTVIARPCHTLGPTQTAGDSRASAQFLREAAAGRPIVLKSRGEAVRSYLYGADCAAGILTVLLRGEGGRAYNVAGPETVSIARLAQAAARAGGTEVVFDLPSEAEKAGYSPNRQGVLRGERLMALGWEPRLTIEEAVERSVALLQSSSKEESVWHC